MTQRVRRRKSVATQSKPGLMPLQLQVGAIALLTIVGGVQFFSSENVQIRQEKSRLRLEKLELQARVEQSRLEAIEGNRRYAQGCVMTYMGTPDANGYFHEILPLSLGMRIVSDRSGLAIADGQFVCDHQFMTFEIVDGVTANPARADDATVVNARFEDYAQWHPRARRGAIVEAQEAQ